MKLYYSSGSLFFRKIRVLLLEMNIPHETELVDLWGHNDLTRTNPLGKVPVLKVDDGRVLVNSPLTADYVDGHFPGSRFIPVDAEGRLEVRRWEALADGTMDAAVASFYEARFHDEQRRSQAWLDHQRGKLDSGFATLEAMLDGRKWCVGNAMSLADITLGCPSDSSPRAGLRFFRRLGIRDWHDCGKASRRANPSDVPRRPLPSAKRGRRVAL